MSVSNDLTQQRPLEKQIEDLVLALGARSCLEPVVTLPGSATPPLRLGVDLAPVGLSSRKTVSLAFHVHS